MYYKYDENSCVVIEKSEVEFDIGLYCYSDIDFDLDLNEVIVGLVSSDGKLLKYAVFVKPVEELARLLKETRAKVTATELSLLDTDYRICVLELGI
jgi:hypothetical protein